MKTSIRVIFFFLFVQWKVSSFETQRRVLRTPPLASANGGEDNDKDAYQFSDFRQVNGYTMPEGKSGGYRVMLPERGFLFRKLFSPRVNQAGEENEDGWRDMRKNYPFWKRIFKSAKRILVGEGKRKEPGTLILVRHGESLWNANKTFTGWADPDLSDRGRREVEHAARLLLAGGYEIDVVFTSRLTRAIRSVWIILQELNEVYLPVFKSWRKCPKHRSTAVITSFSHPLSHYC